MAVAAVALVAGASAGVAAGSLAVGLAIGAATAFVAGSLAPDMPDVKANDFGAQINSSGADTTIPVIYGKTRTGATRIYHEVVDDEYLLLVYSLAEGEIEGIEQIYLDGKELFTGISGAIQSGTIGQANITDKFRDHVQVQVTNGSDDQSVMDMIKTATASSERPWTDAHRARGRVLVGLKILRDVHHGEIQAAPTITALVRGKRIMDPRRAGNPVLWIDNDDVSEHREVGRNPALCILDYLTNTRYGAGIPISKIDVESFAAAANWCDSIPFKADGVLNQSQSYRKNLDELLSSFNGHLLDDGGKLYLLVEDVQPVIHTFDESNLIGSVASSFGSSSVIYNTIEAKFKDPNADYNTEVYVADDLAARTKDGKTLKKTISLNFTKDHEQVQKLASWALNKSRYPFSIQFTSGVSGLLCRPFDVIEYSDPELGIENKKFRVLSVDRELGGELAGTAKISAVEYEDTIYGAYHGNYMMPPPSTSTLPGPWDIEPPRNLAFTLRSFSDSGTGLLTWDAPAQFAIHVVSYSVQYRIKGSTSWNVLGETTDTQFRVQALVSDTYEFRVASKNTFGNLSTFAYIESEITDDIVLPKVTGLAVQGQWDAPDLTITWDDMDSLPVGNISGSPLADGQELVGFYRSTYEVQIMDANGVIRDTVQVKDNQYTYSYQKNKQDGLTRSLQFTVRIVSKSGNRHPKSNVLSVYNAQHGALSGLQIAAAANTLFVTFDAQQSDDFDGVLIYAGNTPNFSPSSSTQIHDQQTGNQAQVIMPTGSKYIRVAGYDIFGKDQLVYSAAENIEFGMQFSEILGTENMLVPKTDVNGQVTGLGAPMDETGPFPPLVIVSDQFQIANGLTGFAPFEVQDGKVKINTAVVNEIHASDIYAESVSALSGIMGEVQSNTYTEGTSGFKLFDNGSAEFNDLHVRGLSTFEGTLNGADGSFTGSIQSSNYDPVAKNGFRVDAQSGDAIFHNITSEGGVISGSTITGSYIDGGTVKGATIIASSQVRVTDAGDPYYTTFDSTGATITDNTPTRTVYTSYQQEYQLDTDLCPFYPYNAGPTGIENADHFRHYAVTLNISGSFNSPEWSRGANESEVWLEILDANGVVKATILNLPYATGSALTQNGITCTPTYETRQTGNNEAGPVYNTFFTGWTINGSFTGNFGTGWGGDKFKIRFRSNSWRGSTTGVTGSVTATTATY